MPDRYEVTRRGTPDPPDAAYYVLDYAHDYHARVALATYVHHLRSSQQHERADAIAQALAKTQPVYQAYMESKNPKARAKRDKSMGS